ncbi:MAG: hypothetical protein O3A08_14235 [Proteobacteria bacterium]|jgi:hypothetical protein|nr:hypothetical protein [Pseudomonadota bacterium]MDA1287542.1 hypothetical protein [Pseudomonadota bacterium]NQW14916.1 hypothetical protein [Rhodobacter sp.]
MKYRARLDASLKEISNRAVDQDGEIAARSPLGQLVVDLDRAVKAKAKGHPVTRRLRFIAQRWSQSVTQNGRRLCRKSSSALETRS